MVEHKTEPAALSRSSVSFETQHKPRSGKGRHICLVGLIAAFIGLAWTVIPMIGAEFASMGRILGDLVNNAALADKLKQQLPPDSLAASSQVLGGYGHGRVILWPLANSKRIFALASPVRRR